MSFGNEKMDTIRRTLMLSLIGCHFHSRQRQTRNVKHELYLAILYYQLSAVGHYYSAADVSVERKVNMNEPYCKFRFGVECSSNACEKCGWNPIVEADRIEKMKKGREPYLKIDLSKVRGRE